MYAQGLKIRLRPKQWHDLQLRHNIQPVLYSLTDVADAWCG